MKENKKILKEVKRLRKSNEKLLKSLHHIGSMICVIETGGYSEDVVWDVLNKMKKLANLPG